MLCIGGNMTSLRNLKPVVLVTVYRRYKELELTLRAIKEYQEQFVDQPEVVIIWAAPVVGHYWYFDELKKDGLFNHLITRQQMPGDGSSHTTNTESYNIRKGLSFIKKEYGNDFYAIVQAADVCVSRGTYGLLNIQMNDNECDAFGFRWSNNCTLHAWHTNLFAVTMNESSWPPLAEPNDQDTLERKWGLHLRDNKTNIVKWNNDNNKWFAHGYKDVDNFVDSKWVTGNVGMNLCITGQHKYWLMRRLYKLNGVLSFIKYGRKK